MFDWGRECRLILLADSIALATPLRSQRVVQRSIVQGSMGSSGSDPSGGSMGSKFKSSKCSIDLDSRILLSGGQALRHSKKSFSRTMI